MSWIELVPPLVQGLVGGSAAVLVWEAALKPRMARKSLAHILREEVAHNLQYSIGLSLKQRADENELISDFRLSAIVFDAVASRLGELPEFTGRIHLLYRRIELLNRTPDQWAALTRRYKEALSAVDFASASVIKQQRTDTIQMFLKELDALEREAHSLLGDLWRESYWWYQRREIKKLARIPTLAQFRERSAKGMGLVAGPATP